MSKPFTVFQAEDGLWHAKFSPRVASMIGNVSSWIVAAPSQEGAKSIAGAMTNSVLGRQQTATKPFWMKKRRTIKPPEPPEQPKLF